MLEVKRIIAAFENLDFSTHAAALATVIKVEGSSYRSPGAKMFISRNGKWEGSISGGCLEGDALKRARSVMERKEPEVITYDTNEDTNKLLGVNLGCQGIIHIFLENIEQDSLAIEALRQIQDIEVPHLMATVIPTEGQQVQRILVAESGTTVLSNMDSAIHQMVEPDIQHALSHHHSSLKEYSMEGRMVRVFLEVFEPAIDVLIVGGGFDAKPVASFAQQLGWRVRLTDECAAHVFPVNFPGVEVMQCQREYVAQKVTASRYTAAILMTHNLDYDREVLIQLLETPVSYIGIVGPQKRWERIRTQLEDRNIQLNEKQLKLIHAPVGLDIGADTPEEIGMAILAEIKAHFANRAGGSLKYRTSAIHTKNRESGEVYKPIQLNQ